jgi:hypothetical protein
MRVKLGLIGVGVVLAVAGFAAAALVGGASAHSNPCHSQHTCPSDHHTYVWTDLTTGLQWDCAEPGAPEYDPTRDTTTIIYAGLTYYCRAAGSTTTTTTTTTVTTTLPTTATEPTTTTTPIPTLVLPIKSLTPGALNRAVRQGTIGRTICRVGWTRTVRPSSRYTNALKLKQMPLYEETGPPSAYEEDHLIPLELGGAPRNPKNLWPEPRSQAKTSDPLETKLKRLVCKRLVSLARARAAIRKFKNEHG